MTMVSFNRWWRRQVASDTGFHWRRPHTWRRSSTVDLVGSLVLMLLLVLLVGCAIAGGDRFHWVGPLAVTVFVMGMIWLPWQQRRTMAARYTRLPTGLRHRLGPSPAPCLQAQAIERHERSLVHAQRRQAQAQSLQAQLETHTLPAASSRIRPPRL